MSWILKSVRLTGVLWGRGLECPPTEDGFQSDISRDTVKVNASHEGNSRSYLFQKEEMVEKFQEVEITV